MFFGKVNRLGAVILKLMQFDAIRVVGHDKLPITLAHGEAGPPIGLLACAGPFPENGTRTRDEFAFEGREKVFAIALIVSGLRHSDGSAERGKHIDGREDGGIVFCTGWRVARPAHDEWHAHAAFE